MKNRYRIPVALMGIMMIFLCSSCANKHDMEREASSAALSKKETSTEEPENEEGKIRVGFISKSTADPFFQEMNQYAEETLDGLQADGRITSWTGILDGENNPDVQNRLAGKCIEESCDYVFFAPSEPEAADPAVTRMAEAGIKVIVLNAKTASTDEAAWVYCGSSEKEAGKLVGQFVLDHCPGAGRYLHVSSVLGSTAHIDFSQGVMQILEAQTELEPVSEEITMMSQTEEDQVVSIVQAALETYGEELRAVICDTDSISAAAQKACIEAGSPEVLCIGVGGSTEAIDMVRQGNMKATAAPDGAGQVKKGIESMLEDIGNSDSATGRNGCREFDVEYLLVTGD